MGSDHTTILMSFDTKHLNHNTSPIYTSNCNLKRNFNIADWEKYTTIIEKDLKSLLTQGQDLQIKDLYDTIAKAADIAIPKFKMPFLKDMKDIPLWWNEQCSKAVFYRRLAFTNFKQIVTPVNYQKFETAQLKARSTIQKAKKITWKNVCREISNTKNTSKAYNLVRKLKTNKGIIHHNIQHNIELSEQFMKQITTDHVCHKFETSNMNIKIDHSSNTGLEVNFTTKELKIVIATKTKDTAPGWDNLLNALTPSK